MEQMYHSESRTKLTITSEIEEDDDDPPTYREKVSQLKPQSPPSVPFRDLGVSGKPKQNKTIKLGQTFTSFAEVSQAIRYYQNYHKVSLTQKYFRRIAANPKPTNKEDYSLSEEERKRFVYRWVDFCCKYFEGEAGGYSMKECPMRIRFQLRFTERDLIISIFRDDHDHEIPEGESQPSPSCTRTEAETVDVSYNHSVTSVTTTTKNVVQQNKKCMRPPPPLALSTSVLGIQNAHRRSSPYSIKSFEQNSFPKPPPLKKGCVAMPSPGIRALNQEVDKERAQRLPLSVENVVRSIYQYLCRTHSAETELCFLTSKPDLIKITSDISGVDIGTVLTVCDDTGNSRQATNASASVKLLPSTFFTPSNNGGADSHLPRILRTSKHKRKSSTVSFNNDSLSSSLNSQEELCNDAVYKDSARKLVNLPLEVIIKTDPDSIDYYDEDDSGGMTMDDDYLEMNARNHSY